MPNVSLAQDDLVEKLVPDAGNVETFQMLYGWLGKSTRKGHIRLYDDLDMKVYVEFSEKDVQLTQSLKTSNDPIGGTLVWLSEDAKVIDTAQRQSDADARSFLDGDFAKAMGGYQGDIVIQDDLMAAGANAMARSRRKRICVFKRTLYWATCRPCCW